MVRLVGVQDLGTDQIITLILIVLILGVVHLIVVLLIILTVHQALIILIIVLIIGPILAIVTDQILLELLVAPLEITTSTSTSAFLPVDQVVWDQEVWEIIMVHHQAWEMVEISGITSSVTFKYQEWAIWAISLTPP